MFHCPTMKKPRNTEARAVYVLFLLISHKCNTCYFLGTVAAEELSAVDETNTG
jgi:hypothetical protein